MVRQKKYKIDQELRKLNLSMYRRAIRYLPSLLGIAYNTFHKYRTMDMDSKDSDLSYDQVRKLEVFFGLRSGELINYKIECKSLKEMVKEELKKAKKKAEQEDFNLL